MWGFERGRIYNRREDIHGRFGGQQQGGIITPSQHAVVIIITGEAGLAHGYADRLLPDGTFEYFGEGQKGDMQFLRGNRAVAEHSQDGKDLLLFRKTKQGLRFEGAMVCAGSHFEEAPDSENKMRRAIVFELQPLEAFQDDMIVGEASKTGETNLPRLRERALAAVKATPGKKTSTSNVFERSRVIAEYVVARAKGQCEGCGTPAPFKRPNGVPYLEPHHIRRLTDGGPDDPHHMIALCPNCHRRVHHGDDGEAYNEQLRKKMKTIEP